MTKKKASARRGLRLLWHRLDRPSRGPKPMLTLGDIIESAIAIADRDGLTALSMRSVAERLGFTTMSLYRYVPGKGELVEVMRDVALGEPPAIETGLSLGLAPAQSPGPSRRGLDWREQLRRWARANLDCHHRHPWLLDVEIHGPQFGPNQLLWLDAGLRAFTELPLSEEHKLALVLMLDSYTRGQARILVGLAQEQKRARGNLAELQRLYASIFEAVVVDPRYPALARAVASGMFQGVGKLDEFEFGLERLLDGIAAFVAAQDVQ